MDILVLVSVCSFARCCSFVRLLVGLVRVFVAAATSLPNQVIRPLALLPGQRERCRKPGGTEFTSMASLSGGGGGGVPGQSHVRRQYLGHDMRSS
jgi:hypothetical protein